MGLIRQLDLVYRAAQAPHEGQGEASRGRGDLPRVVDYSPHPTPLKGDPDIQNVQGKIRILVGGGLEGREYYYQEDAFCQGFLNLSATQRAELLEGLSEHGQDMGLIRQLDLVYLGANP